MNEVENFVGKHSDVEEFISWVGPQLPGREKFDLALLFALGMLCEDWEVRNFLEEERATWPCRLPWGCFVKTLISNPGRVRHSMRTLSDVDVADVVFDS